MTDVAQGTPPLSAALPPERIPYPSSAVIELGTFLARAGPLIGGAAHQEEWPAVLDRFQPIQLALPPALLNDPPERVTREMIHARTVMAYWDTLVLLGYEPTLERQVAGEPVKHPSFAVSYVLSVRPAP